MTDHVNRRTGHHFAQVHHVHLVVRQLATAVRRTAIISGIRTGMGPLTGISHGGHCKVCMSYPLSIRAQQKQGRHIAFAGGAPKVGATSLHVHLCRKQRMQFKEIALCGYAIRLIASYSGTVHSSWVAGN
jgi:hypothetical protein